MKGKFKNGDKVRDKISGLEGTITCVAFYMNGCIRYSIQAKLNAEGFFVDAEVIDEQNLELIKPIKKKIIKPTGGDRPFMPKYKL